MYVVVLLAGDFVVLSLIDMNLTLSVDSIIDNSALPKHCRSGALDENFRKG